MPAPAAATKIAALRSAWAAGDRIAALRIAARFPRLGDDREVITRGWAAHTNPAFYAELGRDPASLVDAALAAVAARYGLA